LTDKLPKGFFAGPPDLAVEVLSPDDRSRYVEAKIHDWLESGCHSVWVVDPSEKTVAIHASSRECRVFHLGENVSDVILPGFEISVEEIFE
jgi:Uma2 family endonuclease